MEGRRRTVHISSVSVLECHVVLGEHCISNAVVGRSSSNHPVERFFEKRRRVVEQGGVYVAIGPCFGSRVRKIGFLCTQSRWDWTFLRSYLHYSLHLVGGNGGGV